MTKTIGLTAAMLLGATGALAQPSVVVTGEPAPFRIVSYADLNLASKPGQDRLVHRIRAAASDLCYEGNKEEVKFAAARRHCFDTALSGGLQQMDKAIAARTSGPAFAAATLTVTGR